MHLTKEPEESGNTEVNNCVTIGDKKKQLETDIGEYKVCKDSSCRVSKIKSIQGNINDIRFFCNSSLQYRNVSYNGTKDPCIQECLDFDEFLIEKGWDNGIVRGSCGFTNRLLTWVYNIMKWIKYILPVLVIILSIIDFIKVISKDKDDEIKKAQKNFIIRLIAAALTFILPLIITFILDKMGFDVYTCGLWK